jgi:hypothetical protein
MNARNIIENGAGLALFDTAIGDRDPGEGTMSLDKPLFTADTFATNMYKLLTERSFTENTQKMKIAAIAAGGGDRADKAIRDFYVESLLHKPGEHVGAHLFAADWLKASHTAGSCKCCCSFFIIFLLVVFLALYGFPGLLHIEKFAGYYDNLPRF